MSWSCYFKAASKGAAAKMIDEQQHSQAAHFPREAASGLIDLIEAMPVFEPDVPRVITVEASGHSTPGNYGEVTVKIRKERLVV